MLLRNGGHSSGRNVFVNIMILGVTVIMLLSVNVFKVCKFVR